MDLIPAFHFALSLGPQQSPLDASFMDVGGIESSMSAEEVVEGGENGFVWKLPTVVKHPNLTLKRGIVDDSSRLVSWCRDVLGRGPGLDIQTQSLWLFLLDAEGQGVRAWAFRDAYPVKWKVDNFNSTKNELAIETIELAYHACERLY